MPARAGRDRASMRGKICLKWEFNNEKFEN